MREHEVGLLLLGPVLLAAAACAAQPTAISQSPGPKCVAFANELIDSIAWRRDGAELAVATYDRGSGDGVIRLVPFPTLGPITVLWRSPAVLSANGLAASPTGYAWVEHANRGVDVVTSTANGRQVLGYVDTQLYSLRSTGWSLLAVDEDLGGQIVRLDEGGRGLAVVPLTEVDGIVESFDVAPDGRIVYLLSHGPGTAVSFVVVEGETERPLTPSGHLIGKPMFGPNRDEIYFEDHDTGTLRAISIQDGTERVVLDADVSAVAVSLSGAIAHTFVVPTETDRLCIEADPPAIQGRLNLSRPGWPARMPGGQAFACHSATLTEHGFTFSGSGRA